MDPRSEGGARTTMETQDSKLRIPVGEGSFEEFLAQVSFKRISEINGYSSIAVSFTFKPFKTGKVF